MSSAHRTVLGFWVLLISGLIVSCSQTKDVLQAETFDFAGTNWVLESINAQLPLEGTTITLEFDEENYYGNSGCNYYGGQYTATETSLKIWTGPISDIGCSNPVLQQEDMYLRAFAYGGEVGYVVSETRLELAGVNTARLIFARKP